MKYNYLVRTKTGEMQTGVIEATDKSAAVKTLQSHNLLILNVLNYLCKL